MRPEPLAGGGGGAGGDGGRSSPGPLVFLPPGTRGFDGCGLLYALPAPTVPPTITCSGSWIAEGGGVPDMWPSSGAVPPRPMWHGSGGPLDSICLPGQRHARDFGRGSPMAFLLKGPCALPRSQGGGSEEACQWLSFHLVKFRVHLSLPLPELPPLALRLAEQFRL